MSVYILTDNKLHLVGKDKILTVCGETLKATATAVNYPEILESPDVIICTKCFLVAKAEFTGEAEFVDEETLDGF